MKKEKKDEDLEGLLTCAISSRGASEKTFWWPSCRSEGIYTSPLHRTGLFSCVSPNLILILALFGKLCIYSIRNPEKEKATKKTVASVAKIKFTHQFLKSVRRFRRVLRCGSDSRFRFKAGIRKGFEFGKDWLKFGFVWSINWRIGKGRRRRSRGTEKKIKEKR